MLLINHTLSDLSTAAQKKSQRYRFLAPFSLRFASFFTPYAYTSLKTITSVFGYILYFIPTIIAASIITAELLGLSYTSLFAIGSKAISTLVPLLVAHPFVAITAGLVMYAVSIIAVEPTEPSVGKSVREPYEWQKLKTQGLYVCFPVFIASSIVFYLTASTIALVVVFASSWWTSRRLAMTVTRDETHYLETPPYTEYLLVTRIPLATAFALVLFTETPLFVSGILSLVPFVTSARYLRWRSRVGDNSKRQLRDKRMYEYSDIPQEFVEDFTGSGAFVAFGTEELLRESVRKFNSFLDTEIDTEKRVDLPESRITLDDIERIQDEVDTIHNDFKNVAYRPKRFEDLKSSVFTYSQKLRTTIKEDAQASR